MESSVLKTEADFFPNSWFDHHGGFLHFEEREDRKKQNAEEMEFVKVQWSLDYVLHRLFQTLEGEWSSVGLFSAVLI